MIKKIKGFLENDKVKHFVFSYFSTSVLFQITSWVFIPIAAVFIIGVLKEFTDTKFDFKDILANTGGILLSTILYLY